MIKRGMVLLLVVVLGGCTRVVDDPKPQSAPPVAPIAAGQVADLLSPEVKGQEGNLFVTVEPEECAGVAREVDPPFIFEHNPAAHDGGHWVAEDGQEVYIEEMVGVYRADFDPKAALADAQRTIDKCGDGSFVVNSMQEREYVFRLVPPVRSPSPNIVLWSFNGDNWACDSAFIAAHNAAIEISTCAYKNGYDVASLAEDALKRIERLANTTM